MSSNTTGCCWETPLKKEKPSPLPQAQISLVILKSPILATLLGPVQHSRQFLAAMSLWMK